MRVRVRRGLSARGLLQAVRARESEFAFEQFTGCVGSENHLYRSLEGCRAASSGLMLDLSTIATPPPPMFVRDLRSRSLSRKPAPNLGIDSHTAGPTLHCHALHARPVPVRKLKTENRSVACKTGPYLQRCNCRRSLRNVGPSVFFMSTQTRHSIEIPTPISQGVTNALACPA